MTQSITKRKLNRFEKALAEAAKVFNNLDVSGITLPTESPTDILREAASVVAYFDLKEKFREETCRSCGLKFAYAFYTTAVKCCSVPCMADHLASMGLTWDPSAPLERRWGPRGVPAIVPASVYAIIQEQTPPKQEKPEPVISQEATDLISKLKELC